MDRSRGIIGLEMGTVYSTLGARLDVVEMMDSLMLGADRDLVKFLAQRVEATFDQVMVSTKVTSLAEVRSKFGGLVWCIKIAMLEQRGT